MPGVPPNSMDFLKKFGRSLLKRRKNKKTTSEETPAVAGESSTEAAPPASEAVPMAVTEPTPVEAAPAVEKEPVAPVPAPAPAPALAVDALTQEELATVAKTPDAPVTPAEPPVTAASVTERSESVDVPRTNPTAAVEVQIETQETPAPVEAAT